MAFTLVIVSCSQEKKLARKASNAVERSDFDLALSYYDQILAKDSNSYYANAGKGVVLSEYVGNHAAAIPYLEKALRKSPEKTDRKLNYDLGKSYHFVGNYPRALYFYGVVAKYNKPGSPDYDMFLNKRIADSKYAMEHPEVAPPEEQWVKSVGNDINTTMPEYGAVYTHNKLIFTSKRKDEDKEKKNGLDGRYFEGMYVSYVNGNSYSTPRRYTVPDTRGTKSFSNPHESVVSVSPDGNTLYIYRAGQIYETDLNDSTKSAHKLGNNINISYLQSHATLSADGKMLVFASEADRGIGGLDLYKSVKDENGNWGYAQLLSSEINTIYNEDAPFLSPSGVLFFSSNGLPGYGGYDVYKANPEGTHWGKPINIGQPINSTGDDVYFTLIGNTSNGYYTSVRTGGVGDMDIYKVHYMSTDIPACGKDSLLALTTQKDVNNEMAYTFAAQLPQAYAANARSFSWQVNGVAIDGTTDHVNYTFASAGSYTVSAKGIAYCDSCPSLLAFCSQRVLEIGTPMYVNNDSLNAANTQSAVAKTAPRKTRTAPATKENTTLNEAQLRDMKWVTSPAYFNFNESTLRDDAKAALDQNISVLKKNNSLAVNINGYADSRGSEQYNIGLSQRRANMVKSYMIENGVPQRRILATRGYGETNLVNGCSDGVECTESEHQMNRRVEFEVINLVKSPSDITLK